MSQRIPQWAYVAALIAVALLLYARNLDDYFQGDDFDLIHSFYGQSPRYFFELLYDDESGGVWDYLCLQPDSECPNPERHGFLRPLKIWLLKADLEIWGTNALGFHLTSSLFFVANIVLLFLILRLLLPGQPEFAFLGAWLAAIHPVFAEIVPSITYREETIASALGLAALYLFLRHRRGESGAAGFHVFYGLSLLTKESALSTVGLAAGYDLVYGLLEKHPLRALMRRARFYVPTLFILAGYFTLRWIAFGNIVGGHGETDHLDPSRFVSFHTTLFSYLFARPMLALHWIPAVGTCTALLVGLLVLVLIWRRERLDREYFANLIYAGPVWYAAATGIAYGVYFSPRHIVPAVLGLVVFAAVLLAGVARALALRPQWPLVLAAVVLSGAAFLPPTLEMSARYERASETVSRIRMEIELQASNLPDGSRILLIDVPQFRVLPPPYFGHALGSALGLPFTRSNLAQRPIAIEWATSRTLPRGTEQDDYDLVLKFGEPEP